MPPSPARPPPRAHAPSRDRAAGMDAFGYAGGLTPAAALAGPATTVFDDMRQLPWLLGVQALPSR